MEVHLSTVTEKLVNDLADTLKERYNDNKTFTIENVVHLAVVRLYKAEVESNEDVRN